MKPSQDKIKDFVEPQAFDEVGDFAADPARVLAAYRFTDATADLLARWLDALATLPAGRGAAHALAGLRGVGKSHLLATFAALVAAPELRMRVTDAHVAASAKRLSSRRFKVIRVERGTRPTLGEELRAACIAGFGRDAAGWGEDPPALLASALARAGGATLVLIADTAYGREQRVERDDGPALSQLAAAAQATDAFVALALDDDIAGADGINAALVQTYHVDYLEPEHLYRIADLYLLRKQTRARAALHEIYLTLRHTIPNFNWSEQRFAALYPVHPLVADVSAAVRLHAPSFAFLPFAARAALQALNRPALSLILLDEVFDRTEADLRRAQPLAAAFAVYDELAASGVAQFPALQRLQVRLVLKLLFILSLDGRGASARDLCAALLYHDESAPLAGVQRIETTLEQLAACAPAGGLVVRTEQGEVRYRFRLDDGQEFEEELNEAVARQPADEAALLHLLAESARARFSDWPFAADATELQVNWRGALRRGRCAQATPHAHDQDEPDAAPHAPHYEWTLLLHAPATTQTDGSAAALDSTASLATDDAQTISFVWQPATPKPEDMLVLRRLLALRTDPALGAFVEPCVAANAALTAQVERLWVRLHLEEAALTCAGQPVTWPAEARHAPTLAALVTQLLDAPLAARYPQHPAFEATLNETDASRLVACMFGALPEADAQTQIAQLARPLGLARERADGHTLECGPLLLDAPWCRALLALVETAGRGGVTLAEAFTTLGSAPYGLTRPAQQLVLAALVAQRRLELIMTDGARLARGSISERIDWPEVCGVARATAARLDDEALTDWARRLTSQPALASVASADGRAAVRAALAAWLEDWRASALGAHAEQLLDEELTLRAWKLVTAVRRTFGVVAEAVAALCADAIPLEEGLQRVADAFGNAPEQFARAAEERAQLSMLGAGGELRERVRAYLAGAEPTASEEIECARRELLHLSEDAHGLFDAASRARFERLWQEFHARYAAHYAEQHERATTGDPEAFAAVLADDAWREFEALAQLPFVNARHWHEAEAFVTAVRRARCGLDVRALLDTRPTCACHFRLTRADDLTNAAARLAEIVARGRAAARRTLALFRPHLARTLHLLARERSGATAERALRLAEAFREGQTPTLLTRADVRLVARACELAPPAEPLLVPPPDLNHGPLSRAELRARLDDWLACLPHDPARLEVAAKMEGDAA
ncbi:MAG TPA: hypothetical protein VF546_01395 [Pyrinomonadaceae bacterium]|jgi:hypothetical protein